MVVVNAQRRERRLRVDSFFRLEKQAGHSKSPLGIAVSEIPREHRNLGMRESRYREESTMNCAVYLPGGRFPAGALTVLVSAQLGRLTHLCSDSEEGALEAPILAFC